jgi:bifunctional ADP-heptose synthase (sugar kinase/adenylyltransferase)
MSGRVVVAGDVMADVVATLAEPIAHGSDTPARVVRRGGGAGANVAVWLARAGAEVTLVARVGDDIAGRVAVDVLREEGVNLVSVLASPEAERGSDGAVRRVVVLRLGTVNTLGVVERLRGAGYGVLWPPASDEGTGRAS